MSDRIQVPADENEITVDWLKKALVKTFPHASFKMLTRTRIGEAYGFASRIFRVQWQDADQSPAVVIKLWDTHSKANIEEIRFYQTFTDVGLRIPTYFFSAVDTKTQRAVLVLEAIDNAVQGDVLHLLELERAQKIAQQLAKMHARWFNNPRLTKLSWLPDITIWNGEVDWFRSRRALFLERFPDHLTDVAHAVLDRIEWAPQTVNARWANAPKTLLHGDFHLDNILFEKQTDPVFLDWTRPLTGPPVSNLANLLFAMTPLENYDQLLEAYRDAFQAASGQKPARITLEKQLGGALLRLFTQKTCGIARWQPTSQRGQVMQQRSMKQTNALIPFWYRKDPTLFSFLD